MAGQLAVRSNLSSSPYVHNSHYTCRRTTCALRRKIGPECQSCQEFFLPLHCFAFFLPTGTLQFLHLVIRCLSNVTFSNSLFSELLWSHEGFRRISQAYVCCSEKTAPQHRISAVIVEREVRNTANTTL